ncbi:MAG: TonB-dependent receptor [Ignavibacteria bacterium]|nr:TonB-dependent receptor [Ignavibacteria bacterium]
MKIIFILFTALALLFQSGISFSQGSDSAETSQVTIISGKVTGEKNEILSGANLVIEGTIDGSTSDEKGFYEFETEKSGQANLIVTSIDYATKNIPIDILPGQNMVLNVKLTKTEIKTDEILVTASSFTSGNNTAVTLTPLEIVRIPGADADLYRAITTFPGSNQVNEGSRITVRGGNPNEVLTIVDMASLYNPFIFDETFNTSSYSTINPWGLKGINFTSGGFSAKYGNVLSAVLDLKSYDMPQGSGMFAWLGLANASLSGVYLSDNRKIGATFTAGKLFLEPFFAINGKHSEYSPIPQSNQLGGTLSFTLGKTGNLKMYGNYSDDKVGIKNAGPTFDGFFEGSSKNYFSNIKLTTAPSVSTLLSVGGSFSLNENNSKYGVLNTTEKNIYSKGRAEYTLQLNNKTDLNTGLEYEYNEYDITGTVPLYSYNLALNAPSLTLDTNSNSGRLGAYLEAQIRLTDDLFVIPGVRTDYHSLSSKASFDPRISFGYLIKQNHTVRGAFGLYHQYPSLLDYSRSRENELEPESALHYILGYEYNNENKIIFRVEGYYKDYSNLVLFNRANFFYGSEGDGNVKGVDVFFKTKISNKFTGWISYAYSDSRRRQFDAQILAPSNYDITNNMSIVGSYNLSDKIVLGLSYKLSTGKPYTPVSGSTFDSTMNVYVPIYAEINSGRFPTYDRLDMNAQYIFSLFGKFAVGVLAVNNIFNKDNLYDYTYNSDYSTQLPIYTNNKRTLYVGLGLQL